MSKSQYIHYIYKNYLEHGITKDGGEKANPQQILKEVKSQIKMNKVNATSEKIARRMTTILTFFQQMHQTGNETEINNLYSQFKKDMELSEDVSNGQIDNIIIDPILNETQTVVEKGIFDPAHFRVIKESANNRIKNLKKSSARDIDKMAQSGYQYDVLSRQLDQLEKIAEANWNNDKIMKNIVDEMIRVAKEGLDLIKMQNHKGTTFFDTNFKAAVYVLGEESYSGEEAKKKAKKAAVYIRTLKKIFAGLSTGDENSSSLDVNKTGRVLEVAAKVSGEALKKLYATEMEKVALEVRDLSQDRSHSVLKAGSFGGYAAAALGDNISGTIDLGGNQYIQLYDNATQGKIDIYVYSKKGKSVNIAASLKNVSFKADNSGIIHFHKGSNPVQALSEYENFTMHYLNIVPKRVGGKGFTYNHEMGDLEYSREQYHNVLKGLLLLSGAKGTLRIEGGKNFVPNSNLLIINNSTAGYSEVLPLSKLFNYVKNNLDNIENALPGIEVGGDEKGIDYLENTYIYDNSQSNAASAEARIIKLFQDFQKQNLTITLPVKSLQSASLLKV